jgi:hypothetical protein
MPEHDAWLESTSVDDLTADLAVDQRPDYPDADLDAERFGSGSSGALPFVVSAKEQFAALDDPPVTGEARVDAATARLAELIDLPTSDHVAVYDDLHRRLQDALAHADVR